MDSFSFIFSLYSIILGLALTTVLGGSARAIQRRRKVRVGWATGLLAATLVADITLFWRVIWGTRSVVPDTSTALFAGVMICGLYYSAAVLLFPAEGDQSPDLNEHFMAERSKILGCLLSANLLAYACRLALLGWRGAFIGWGWTSFAEVVVFMTSCAVGIVVSNRSALVGLMALMLAADLVDPVLALWP